MESSRSLMPSLYAVEAAPESNYTLPPRIPPAPFKVDFTLVCVTIFNASVYLISRNTSLWLRPLPQQPQRALSKAPNF